MKSKLTAACLAVMALASWFTVGCSVGNLYEKSTGPLTLQYVGEKFQFTRANGEVVVMRFNDWDSPVFYVGDSFSNIVYTDDGKHVRNFVKAEGWVKGTAWNNPPPTTTGWICSNACTITGVTTTTTK